ncbi:hypothetical protein [Alkalihalobacillus trypoxylicola]|uniref:Uncharacterized protein n=1 Tax=Alkalihalobacillus trypoxylicola TaxID=519424 RepID=A0A161PLW1_9BACI|nr:hypothetical protein [Alkalihalobacillus trypoxylicola]KYG34953.1 hypothetical protein AZF04_01065 [Alkalihalobacillus trypoxylicola]
MKNQQKLVEVAVGRILDKHNVRSSNDLSLNDQAKVKSTVLGIQDEVNKFLQGLNLETVEASMDSQSFKRDNDRSSAKRVNTSESENQIPKVNFFDQPTAKITRKYSNNHFFNQKRF